MKSFLLEIITPDKIVFSDQVEMVTVPSEAGILGILAGHSPLFSKLISGELKILKSGKETFISLGEGFMEVGEGKVSILVTKALHADEIDEEKLLIAKKEAEEALKNPPSPELPARLRRRASTRCAPCRCPCARPTAPATHGDR